ncbi:hypothetical protein ACHAWF_008866, partial [Thalassiosira exigua]
GWYDDDGDGDSFSGRSGGRDDDRRAPRRGGGGGGRGGGEFRRDRSRGGGGGRGNRGRGRGGDSRGSRGGRGGRGGRGDERRTEPSDAGKINLRMLEAAGYQHLYGIAPVLNALAGDARDFRNPEENEEEDLASFRSRLADAEGIDDEDDDEEFSSALDEELYGPSPGEGDGAGEKRAIKPEARAAPCLFVREGATTSSGRSSRSDAKRAAASRIVSLASDRGVPVHEVDKGVLNALCGSRPHQGFVLRCGGRDFETAKRLPKAAGGGGPKVWLALDEVVDPQNLGALLRSAYFLGRGPSVTNDDVDGVEGGGDVGVLVCSKNSSPLSPAVSAASAGALELTTVYATSNLPRLLDAAREDGWRVLGAAAAEAPGGGGGVDAVARDDAWDLGGMEEEDDDDDGGEDYGARDAVEAGPRRQRHYDLRTVPADRPTVL